MEELRLLGMLDRTVVERLLAEANAEIIPPDIDRMPAAERVRRRRIIIVLQEYGLLIAEGSGGLAAGYPVRVSISGITAEGLCCLRTLRAAIAADRRDAAPRLHPLLMKTLSGTPNS